jgi:hypothetical protein
VGRTVLLVNSGPPPSVPSALHPPPPSIGTNHPPGPALPQLSRANTSLCSAGFRADSCLRHVQTAVLVGRGARNIPRPAARLRADREAHTVPGWPIDSAFEYDQTPGLGACRAAGPWLSLPSLPGWQRIGRIRTQPPAARSSTLRRPASGSAYGLRRRFALPAERLISNAAVAGSTAKSSPAVYSTSSTPPLNRRDISDRPTLSDVPPRTLKASSRTGSVPCSSVKRPALKRRLVVDECLKDGI